MSVEKIISKVAQVAAKEALDSLFEALPNEDPALVQSRLAASLLNNAASMLAGCLSIDDPEVIYSLRSKLANLITDELSPIAEKMDAEAKAVKS